MEQFEQKFSDYFDYLDNIRRRVFSMAVVFFASFIVGFFESGNILRYIIGVFKLDNASIVTTSPFQFLDLATKIGLYTGILVCLPLVIYHAYDFLKDGLNKNEKRLFFILMPIGFALFAAGFAYCLTILYFYLESVSAINLSFGIKNIWDVSSFLSQVIVASACLGLVFQFPIVLSFMVRIGLVKVGYLREKRIYAFAGILIFVGFLPPPDVFSTILEATPLILLYELTIWANSAYAAKRGSYPSKNTMASLEAIPTST